MNKVMVLNSTYALVHGNDIDGTVGYECYHGSLERVGHMIERKRTPYKCHTDINGRITYRIESRIAGESISIHVK